MLKFKKVELFASLSLLAAIFTGPFASADIHLITWNMKHLGRKEQKLADVCKVLTGFRANGDSLKGACKAGPDLIMLQEVDTKDAGTSAVRQILDTLRSVFGQTYCAGFSSPRARAEERYAFIWKDSTIKYVTTQGETIETCADRSAQVIPTIENSDFQKDPKIHDMARPPAIAVFYSVEDQKKFVAADVHLVPTEKHPENEVPYLFLYVTTYKFSTYPKFIAGDFNMNSGKVVFQEWLGRKVEHQAPVALALNYKEEGKLKYADQLGAQFTFSAALASDQKTSLKNDRKELSAAYDNVFYQGFQLNQDGGTVQNLYNAFPDWKVKEVYNGLSDHSPVFITLQFK